MQEKAPSDTDAHKKKKGGRTPVGPIGSTYTSNQLNQLYDRVTNLSPVDLATLESALQDKVGGYQRAAVQALDEIRRSSSDYKFPRDKAHILTSLNKLLRPFGACFYSGSVRHVGTAQPTMPGVTEARSTEAVGPRLECMNSKAALKLIAEEVDCVRDKTTGKVTTPGKKVAAVLIQHSSAEVIQLVHICQMWGGSVEVYVAHPNCVRDETLKRRVRTGVEGLLVSDSETKEEDGTKERCENSTLRVYGYRSDPSLRSIHIRFEDGSEVMCVGHYVFPPDGQLKDLNTCGTDDLTPCFLMRSGPDLDYWREFIMKRALKSMLGRPKSDLLLLSQDGPARPKDLSTESYHDGQPLL